MAKLLVHYEDNWADEMDIEAWRIFSSQEEFDDWFSGVPDEPFSHFIGSNEEINYQGKKDYMKRFTVRMISDEDAEVVKKLFCNGYFSSIGKFPDPID